MARFSFSSTVCNLERTAKVLAAVLGVLICAVVVQAKAAPVQFDAYGVFNNGAVMMGTITIDTATGKIEGQDFMVREEPGTILPFSFEFTTSAGPGYLVITINSLSSYDGPLYTLHLVIPARSLVGYDGGSLVPDTGGNKVYTSLSGLGLAWGELAPE